MIYVKNNKNKGYEVLAVCDVDLIGKKVEDKGLKLDITERFYKGALVSEEEAAILMKKAKNINIVGKNAIQIAIKTHIIQKEGVIKIKNIPHALIFEI